MPAKIVAFLLYMTEETVLVLVEAVLLLGIKYYIIYFQFLQ